ncbi:Flp pilus assembly protein CpaB [Thermopolyspora sp. NPDC052614]|uniref:Flp pilus assembly protein CpaB n=1 Tax=Thermopolyspora sp. NPDC052614 TaxID=3155682 RepID=UPI00341A9AF2
MRAFRRNLARRRRPIAALLAAMAMACALLSIRPASGVDILVAARDLPGGRLTPADIKSVAFPPDLLPTGALKPGAPLIGRTLAAPMRAGEPFTDTRLLGPGLLSAYGPGLVATPVRIADADAAGLLSPGDTIDILAAPTDWTGDQTTTTMPVAQNVRVITAPADPSTTKDSTAGALVVLATTPSQAAYLALAQSAGRLTIAIRPRE